jgi:hypothetical protein
MTALVVWVTFAMVLVLAKFGGLDLGTLSGLGGLM